MDFAPFAAFLAGAGALVSAIAVIQSKFVELVAWAALAANLAVLILTLPGLGK